MLIVRTQKPVLYIVVYHKEQSLARYCFLLYINDLPNSLSKSCPRMYADDTHLTYSSGDTESIQSCLNSDLISISHWLTANKLTLNRSKTEFMLIGSSQRLNCLNEPIVLQIDGQEIKQVSSCKSL